MKKDTTAGPTINNEEVFSLDNYDEDRFEVVFKNTLCYELETNHQENNSLFLLVSGLATYSIVP